jgi:hypothetical protein
MLTCQSLRVIGANEESHLRDRNKNQHILFIQKSYLGDHRGGLLILLGDDSEQMCFHRSSRPFFFYSIQLGTFFFGKTSRVEVGRRITPSTRQKQGLAFSEIDAEKVIKQ